MYMKPPGYLSFYWPGSVRFLLTLLNWVIKLLKTAKNFRWKHLIAISTAYFRKIPQNIQQLGVLIASRSLALCIFFIISFKFTWKRAGLQNQNQPTNPNVHLLLMELLLEVR